MYEESIETSPKNNQLKKSQDLTLQKTTELNRVFVKSYTEEPRIQEVIKEYPECLNQYSMTILFHKLEQIEGFDKKESMKML